jgi:anti-anti-sigma factor
MDAETLRVSALDGERGLRLQGELDLATAPFLAEALAGMAGEGQARLDLSGLVFIDSSGLHAIVDFARRENGDGPVILDGVSPLVSTMFEIANIGDYPYLEIRPDGGDVG